MSCDTLPLYPNLFELDSEKLTQIELKCHEKCYLDVTEKLLNRITIDLETLKKYGLTKDDIYTNHRNMYLKFHKVDEFDAYDCSGKQDTTHANILFEKLPANFGKDWSGWGKITNEIMLNHQHLRITCMKWGGAEECPIKKSFTDKYNGYSRGDRDWFVTNLDNSTNIWIPDLLPAQIGMFGFFQSPSSQYRLDPELYIKVMGLISTVSPLKSHKEGYWGNVSGPTSLKFITDTPKIKIINKILNETYTAYLCDYLNKKTLFIHFNDEQWVKENAKNKIKVFDETFYVGEIFNMNDYTQFKLADDVVLDERDDSDIIDAKSSDGSMCSIQ